MLKVKTHFQDMAQLPLESFSQISTYREFLQIWSQKKKRQGGQRYLSKLLNVSPPTVTRILAGKQHLSRDALFRFGRTIKLSQEHIEFLLLTWDLENSQEEELRLILSAKIEGSRRKLSSTTAITDEKETSKEAAIYLAANWSADAILSALRIPSLRTPQALAERFLLSVADIKMICLELERLGLAKRVLDDDSYQPTGKTAVIDEPNLGRVNIRSWSAKASSRIARPVTNPTEKPSNYEAVHVVALSRQKASEFKQRVRALYQEIITESLEDQNPTTVYCYLTQIFEV